MINGLGPAERDRSNGEAAAEDGQALRLAGVTYAKGLGVHAGSDVRYTVPDGCTAFEADVGVDDEVGKKGSVVFEVRVDGVRRFESGRMTAASATRAVSVPVTAGAPLALIVRDAGDGAARDAILVRGVGF